MIPLYVKGVRTSCGYTELLLFCGYVRTETLFTPRAAKVLVARESDGEGNGRLNAAVTIIRIHSPP